MKQRFFSLTLCLLLVLPLLFQTASAAQGTEEIIILYENDVHCSIEGYTKLSALKKELQQTHDYVAAVSSGDYIQGSIYGTISKGETIVDLMNLVGYDALTIGNHEFDYSLERLDELVEKMDTKPVCVNFRKMDEESSYFEPYSLVDYGAVTVAYLGITTPATISSTAPTQFKDEEGNYIFTFCPENLYDVVQAGIDSARSDGADYVIALSHVGDEEPVYKVEELIANTSGLDVVLDGHSHSVIEERIVADKAGDSVVLTSTGAKFEYIGCLTLSEEGIKTELIPTEGYEKTDPVVDAYLTTIEEECDRLCGHKIASSEVDLITHDEDENRLIRISETNLGDFCSDALRYVMDADIGYINGGGIRAELSAGDITYTDLLNVFPFNNTVVLAEIDGQTFRDMLEMALFEWPEECSFPHVSGVTFKVNKAISSSVTVNENEEFCGLSGPYRVYDIKVLDRETGSYEPIDFSKTYTIASNNFYLIDHGSGMTMLENTRVIRNSGMLDVEALAQYAVEGLGGVIGEQYAETEQSITFTDGEIGADASAPEPEAEAEPAPEPVQQEPSPLVTALALLGVALLVCVSAVKLRKATKE